MATLEGFNDFFQALGVTARFFDLGRRIQPMSREVFLRCDRYLTPYPLPYLGHAYLGFIFWENTNLGNTGEFEGKDDGIPDPLPPENTNPMLWSLKLPLDEQGYLCPQARQQFMQQILVAMGKNVSAAESGKALQSVLDNNPYAHKLSEERQAAFFAKVSFTLKRTPNQHLKAVLNYIERVARSSAPNWQDLSLQGIAELACRHKAFEKPLISALPHLPQPVFSSICHLLEHENISENLCSAIIKTVDSKNEACKNAKQRQTSNDKLNPWRSSGIRGLSFSDAHLIRQEFLIHQLALMADEEVPSDIESMIAIAARCPQDLTNPDLTHDYLEILAKFGQTPFVKVTTDLLKLAEVRPHLLAAFRAPDRSMALSQGIGALYQTFQRPTH